MYEVKQCTGFKLEIDEITILTFNNPGINIFSTAVIRDFIKTLDTIRSTEVLKVLVITGEGKTFLAGADIREMSTFSREEATDFAILIHKAMNLVEDFPRPVIAGVNGFALGGGCEIILACDIVIASDVAVFGQPEINIGIIPGAGGTQRLTRRIGRPKSKELIFTGRRIKAEEALSIGLINKVVSRERLMEEVLSLARVIASKPMQCLEASKHLINSGSLEKEIEQFISMFSYEDQKRLMRSFFDKKL